MSGTVRLRGARVIDPANGVDGELRDIAIRDGRTSTETVRRTEPGDDGEHRWVSEEFALLDRAGRVQLPRTHVDRLGLRDRVRLRLEDDHVGVWPDRLEGDDR